LLKKKYDISVKSTASMIPVSFILTETLRRYAGFKVRGIEKRYTRQPENFNHDYANIVSS